MARPAHAPFDRAPAHDELAREDRDDTHRFRAIAGRTTRLRALALLTMLGAIAAGAFAWRTSLLRERPTPGSPTSAPTVEASAALIPLASSLQAASTERPASPDAPDSPEPLAEDRVDRSSPNDTSDTSADTAAADSDDTAARSDDTATARAGDPRAGDARASDPRAGDPRAGDARTETATAPEVATNPRETATTAPTSAALAPADGSARAERARPPAPASFMPDDLSFGRDRERSDALLAQARAERGPARHQLLWEAALAHGHNPHVAYQIAQDALAEGELDRAEAWARLALALRRRRPEYRRLVDRIVRAGR
ncbi:MAG: hypothetical protein KF901_32815 [Myxococcales bacterium]|nr:hypothetical protein [Myxococcales bacterium]